MRKYCIKCGKIIIEDFVKFISDEKRKKREIVEVECPYCGYWEKLKW